MGLFLAPLAQTIGIIVPIIGCFTLFKKEQSKVAMSLMLTNVACLIINSTYMLLMWAEDYDAAITALKVLYLGNALFYFSFILFIATYLEMGSTRLRTILISAWGIIEILFVGVVWTGDPFHLAFMKIEVQKIGFLGITSVVTAPGLLYMIRSCMLTLMLTIGMCYTTMRMFLVKVKEEKHNLARLCGAQFIIVVALHIMLLFHLPFDVVPISASCSIIFIILSVLKGEFFRVTDQARDWVVDNMDNILIITDNYYGYLDSNNYAKKIFPEIANMQKNKLISVDMQSLFFSVNDTFEIDGRIYHKEVTPILQNDKIVGHSLLLMDITQQSRLMDELEQEKIKAEQANEAKSAFMSNMSHEIRTPMNAIVGMTDILLRETLPTHQREYLVNIKNSGAALLTIINDILDFSKIESGKMDIINEEYEPMSMLHDMSMIFLNRIGEKNVELIYDIDPNLPEKLFGDAQRIRQVIINLMNNAIKFTEQGSVTLRMTMKNTSEDTMDLSVLVVDTGQGIRKEDVGKLFGVFQQVDTMKNHYKEGTGLGLSIAKQLVELMGGTIGVESEYEKGSTFYFTIPQGIRSEHPAATVKNEEHRVICISSYFDNALLKSQYEALVASYGVTHISLDEAIEKGIPLEVFFTDEIVLTDVKKYEKLKEWNTRICVLQNPMIQNLSDVKATLINKPLYSLNFCQVINNESISLGIEEGVLCFVAPNAKVLVVDDNEMNLKVVKGLLEPTKIQIETASNGKEAYEKVQRYKYDMLFLDHMMPVMDGVEATMKIRQLPEEYYQKLPIIALSANATTDARKLFTESGFNDFVAKPIKSKELCKCIQTWLEPKYIEVGDGVVSVAGAPVAPACPWNNPVDEIEPIEGIDIAEGIVNSGSKDMFIRLLGDFYKLIDQKATKIEKCLADGLLRDYTIEVHALKSTARMIGALELSEMFYRLEELGNAEEKNVLEQETPKVLSLYRKYKQILEPYGKRLEQEKATVSVDEMIDSLSLLKDAIDTFDLDGADEAMHKLEGYAFPEEYQNQIEELSAYVADVAMEDVIRICTELITELQKA